MVNLAGKRKKASVFGLIVTLLFVIAFIGSAQAQTVQVDTTTEFTSMGGLDPNIEAVSFPPGSTVPFEGKITVSPTTAPFPVGFTVILEYKMIAATTWTAASTSPSPILVGADGTFGGTFTAPSEAGDYDFRLRFPNVNEEVVVDGHRYHWRQSEASVVATVLPEYGIAALGALIACFAAFVVVKKRNSLVRLF